MKFDYNQEKKHIINTLSKDQFFNQPYCSLLQHKEEFISKVFAIKDSLKSARMKHFVVVGMGGSSLGAKSIASMIELENLSFLDELSDFKAKRLFSKLNLKETVFLVISKSGNTNETLVLFDYVVEKIKEKNLNIKNHILTMTIEEEESKLFLISKKNKLTNLPFQKDLSGRFSVFGMTGLLPLCLAGLDIKEIIESLENVFKDLDRVNQLSDILVESIENGDSAQNYWIYDGRMLHFCAWLRQLISESLGKSSDADDTYTLPPFVECRGSRDQHSYLQHTLSLPKRFFNVVFESLRDENHGPLAIRQKKEAERLKFYFDKYNIRTLNITLEKCSVSEVCQFFMIWMLAVQVVGDHYKLDVFKQENIDELKKINL